MENRIGSDETEILHKLFETYRQLSKLHESLNDMGEPIKGFIVKQLDNLNQIIENACKRKIEGSVVEVFGILSEYISAAASYIFAVHVIRMQEDIDTWKHFPVNSYYQKMVQAVDRKVPQVERIFILYKNETTGLAQGYLKHDVRELLVKQKADGIHVKVILEDEIDNRSYIQNWIVIDDKVVEHSSSAMDFAGPYWANRRTELTTSRFEIRKYTERFLRLESYARELDDWLSDLDLYVTAKLPSSPYVQ